MKNKKRWRMFPAYSDRMLSLAILGLTFFGILMIVSAEMSRVAGDNGVIVRTVFRQFFYAMAALIMLSLCSKHSVFQLREIFLRYGFWFMLFLLVLPRLFSPLGGAYAWIRLGGFTIQPSEFAKVFLIIYFSRLLAREEGPEKNRQMFWHLVRVGLAFFGVILFIEKDFGSALVLLGIGFVMLFVSRHPGTERHHRYMLLALLFIGVLSLIILSPMATKIMEKSGDYRLQRFVSSANPFLDPYGSGYHLIMSLVSFANGGLFGLGYGNSIHKYMNFANPSSDFILAIIVEELGFVWGMLPIVIMYGIIFYTFMHYSLLMKRERSRLVLVGVFMYFCLHFVLNVGGVSGLIPLTGVPLLILSSGGTSLVAALTAVGIAQNEIILYRKEIAENENSIRTI